MQINFSCKKCGGIGNIKCPRHNPCGDVLETLQEKHNKLCPGCDGDYMHYNIWVTKEIKNATPFGRRNIEERNEG